MEILDSLRMNNKYNPLIKTKGYKSKFYIHQDDLNLVFYYHRHSQCFSFFKIYKSESENLDKIPCGIRNNILIFRNKERINLNFITSIYSSGTFIELKFFSKKVKFNDDNCYI